MHEGAEQLSDEIDLKELMINLWSNKIIILITTILTIFIGGVITGNSEKEYTARALFKLSSNEKSYKPQLPAGAQGAASLAGITLPGNTKHDDLVERLGGRVFIEQIDQIIGLRSDNFYNSFNPDYVEPKWKVLLKKILGISNGIYNEEEIIWSSTIENFLDNVVIDSTDASNLQVKVVHTNPDRAAEIANTIMNKIISDQEVYQDEIQNFQLQYLSDTLAKALDDLELVKSKMGNYAIENNANPKEGFALASKKLVIAKDKYKEHSELYMAVLAISKLFQNGNIRPTDNEYNALQKSHPIIDQVEFRRIFGQNEIISEWSWPEETTVYTVLKTLDDRRSRLESEVEAAQDYAESFAKNLQEYTKYERDVKTAEAKYQVIMQQSMRNSLFAGIENSQSEVYEYAISPIRTNSSTTIALAISGLIGIFLGILIALVVVKIRGVYSSNNLLISAKNVNFSEKINRKFNRISKKDFKTLKDTLISNPYLLRDLKLEVHKSKRKIVMISNVGSKLKSARFSKILAIDMQADGMRTVLIDFSRPSRTDDNEKAFYSKTNFLILEEFEGLMIMAPGETRSAMSFLTKKEAKEQLHKLSSEFDSVILSVERNDAISLARFLSNIDVFHFSLTRKNKTKVDVLENIYNILPFEAQLYD